MMPSSRRRKTSHATPAPAPRSPLRWPHGVRRVRRDRHHLPLSPAPLLFCPGPPPAPCRLPPRCRLQAYVSVPPLPSPPRASRFDHSGGVILTHHESFTGHDDDKEAAKGSSSEPRREPTSLAPYGLSISPLSKVRTRRRLTRRNHLWRNPTAPRADSLVFVPSRPAFLLGMS